MQLEMEQHGTHCILRLMGDMILSHALELKETLLDVLNDSQQIEVDLADVSDIDSTGVQLLLLLKREAQKAQKTCRLTNHSHVVVDILETYQLSSYFGDPLVIPAVRSEDFNPHHKA